MDLKGSLIDSKIKIIPSKSLYDFISQITTTKDVPLNIHKLMKDNSAKVLDLEDYENQKKISLNDNDIALLSKITDKVMKEKISETQQDESETKEKAEKPNKVNEEALKDVYLEVSDLDWLYIFLQEQRNNVKDTPYLHALLEGSQIKLPENEVLKRNPVLEARCVKLRAQQEAREYRKMTKTVDNVRITHPEDTIAYQLKHMNRHLIAIGQFIISIFAGFLFGFRGVEWMVGNLDFGFRLLLGVMCALVIALAEIYFLAKKLNEELNIAEAVQLGGPTKFEHDLHSNGKKEHED